MLHCIVYVLQYLKDKISAGDVIFYLGEIEYFAIRKKLYMCTFCTIIFFFCNFVFVVKSYPACIVHYDINT